MRKQGWIVERVLEVRRCAHGRSEWTEARLRWAGLNPVNGLPWSDSWEPTSANGVAARNRRDSTRGGGGLTCLAAYSSESYTSNDWRPHSFLERSRITALTSKPGVQRRVERVFARRAVGDTIRAAEYICGGLPKGRAWRLFRQSEDR